MKLIRRVGQQPKALSDYYQDDAGGGCIVMLDFHASEKLRSTEYIRNIPRSLFLDTLELYSCFHTQVPDTVNSTIPPRCE